MQNGAFYLILFMVIISFICLWLFIYFEFSWEKYLINRGLHILSIKSNKEKALAGSNGRQNGTRKGKVQDIGTNCQENYFPTDTLTINVKKTNLNAIP